MRSKLKLQIDDLVVETFAAGEDLARTRGTVEGNATRKFTNCGGFTCNASCHWSEVDCHTQECTTDFNTCFDNGSCCPAECS